MVVNAMKKNKLEWLLEGSFLDKVDREGLSYKWLLVEI